MGVGETLARARRDAGLSVAEVSVRTGIRPSVIEGIERGDFSACGGDYGALGAMATLARVLRADSAALIQAYDAARQPGEEIAAATPSEPVSPAQPAKPVTPAQAAEPVSPAQPAEPVSPAQPGEEVAHARAFPSSPEPWPVTAGQDTDTLPILMGQPPEPVTGGAPASSWTSGEPPLITIGGLPYPVTPSRASTPAFAAHRQVVWIVLWAALFTFTGLGGILIIMGTSGQAAQHATVTGSPGPGSSGASHPGRTRSHSASSHRTTRLASPASRRSVHALIPANIAAFGPGGARQGDNPQLARHALAGKAAVPWHSAWYATPHFGNLQNGTGLLLDMGRTVTITAARIALGHRRGANLTLRIGNSPALASLRPVARAHHAGGVVQLSTTPARGRYVLVWFTKLPPGQAGTFQVSVYDITLRGYA